VRIIVTGRTPEGLAYYTMQLVRGASLTALMRSAALPQQSTADQPPTPAAAAQADTPSGLANVGAGAAPAGPPEGALSEYRQDRYRFAARVGAQAARALAHAHRGGHLHRDVKPSNLMVDHTGQVYLVDFGLTRALLPDGDGTRPGAVRGTPLYMSPEQARGEALDHRSDVYSLGVTLYELATGGVGPYPASRDNAEAVLAQVAAGTLLPLRLLAPEVPPELERIILRCLQRRPRRRYDDAERLAADLERLLSARVVASTRSRPRGLAARRWLSAAVAGAAVLAGAALLALALIPRPVSSTAPAAPGPAPRWDVPASLLTREFLPVHGRQIAGTGKFFPQPERGLMVESRRDTTPTLIALEDVNQPDFEFASELQRYPLEGERSRQDLGVFFGRQGGPAHQEYFFVLTFGDRGTPPSLPCGCACGESAKATGRGGGPSDSGPCQNSSRSPSPGRKNGIRCASSHGERRWRFTWTVSWPGRSSRRSCSATTGSP
jgi:hypothetical protein